MHILTKSNFQTFENTKNNANDILKDMMTFSRATSEPEISILNDISQIVAIVLRDFSTIFNPTQEDYNNYTRYLLYLYKDNIKLIMDTYFNDYVPNIDEEYSNDMTDMVKLTEWFIYELLTLVHTHKVYSVEYLNQIEVYMKDLDHYCSELVENYAMSYSPSDNYGYISTVYKLVNMPIEYGVFIYFLATVLFTLYRANLNIQERNKTYYNEINQSIYSTYRNLLETSNDIIRNTLVIEETA